jgi:fructose transport system substrate-binding protein
MHTLNLVPSAHFDRSNKRSSVLKKYFCTSLILLNTCFVASSNAQSNDIVCSILRSASSPYSQKLKFGAQVSATALGLALTEYASQSREDTSPQISAIENCIASGAKAILIEPTNIKELSPALSKARSSGVLVIVLGEPVPPGDAVDISVSADRAAGLQAAAIWEMDSRKHSNGNGVLLIDENILTQSGSEQLTNGMLGVLGVDSATKIANVDNAWINNDQSTLSFKDVAKAMNQAHSNNQDIESVFLQAGPQLNDLANANNGNFDRPRVLVTDADCTSIDQMSAMSNTAALLEYPEDTSTIAMNAVNEFLKTGNRPIPTKDKSFVDSGMKLAFSRPEVQMPTEPCKIDPRLCSVEPILMVDAKKKCW